MLTVDFEFLIFNFLCIRAEICYVAENRKHVFVHLLKSIRIFVYALIMLFVKAKIYEEFLSNEKLIND